MAARWKMALLLIACVGFVSIFFLIPRAEWDGRAWLGLALFGGGAAIFTLGLIKPATLDLDAEGFTYAMGPFRQRRIAWRDIDRFFVWKPPRGGRMIGYTYAEGRRPRSALSGLNRLVGVDGSLPNLFPLKPEALVEKLEGYRRGL